MLSDSTLPRIPLRELGVGDDHGIALGGIGSDLFPTGRAGEYWMVTDRGPNGRIEVDGEKRRTFPTPDFTPTILRVRADGDDLTVLRTIPLRDRSGDPITGLPNQQGRDEAPYTWDATRPLGYDPNGLDTEGLVRAADGTFWLTEEYSPSLVHVAADGRILARYVPRGLGLTGAGYPVHEVLPRTLLDRTVNRGLESLAVSPDGRRLFLAMQSPIGDETSRDDVVLAFDPLTRRVVGEYVYRFDDVDDFDPGAEGDQSEMKVSGLVALDRHRLLVDERTDDVAKLYVADLRKGTKRLALDLGSVPGVPEKIEGIAVLDRRTVAIANDNDFGMTDGRAAFDDEGTLNDSGVPSRLLTIRLPRPLY